MDLRLRSLLAGIGASTMLVAAGSLSLLALSASQAWDGWPSTASPAVPALEMSPAPGGRGASSSPAVAAPRAIVLASPRVGSQARTPPPAEPGGGRAGRSRSRPRREGGAAPAGHRAPAVRSPSPSPSRPGPTPAAPAPAAARPVAAPSLPAPAPSIPPPASAGGALDPAADVVRGVAPGVAEQLDHVEATAREVLAPVLGPAASG